MIKLKIGDTVKIAAGKDKGREGKIERVFPKSKAVLIPGINVFKKHFKGSQGQKSGIYDIPRPVDLAKIALVCPKCKKATRIGLKLLARTKSRFCRKCGKEIDTK